MDEVTVDRKTLKALGADSRIAILKNLCRKRMTQAELATELGIAAPSVNEHLRQLQSASLIAQIDDGRKWKYYEITQKGRLIVEPTNVKVWFLLSISLLAIFASLWQIYPAISKPVAVELSIPAQGIQTVIQPQGEDAQTASAPFAAQSEVQSADPEALRTEPYRPIPPGTNITTYNATQYGEPQGVLLGVKRTVMGPSLLSSLPSAETLVFLAAVLLLGVGIGWLVKKE